MGTELIRLRVKEENDDILSVPPGFESYAAFTLKREQDGEKPENQDRLSYSPSASSSASYSVPLEMETDGCDDEKLTKSLRRRPWINYGQIDENSEDQLKSGELNQNLTFKPSLPKGVIRGCPQCDDCQKVSARWRPEHACRPDLEDAPVFYPNEEEFEDTLKYIASIRPIAEPYGICRIVPPRSWKPPCLLREKTIWEASKFATRLQRVDKLQNRNSSRKISKLNNHSRKKRRRCMSDPADVGVCGAEDFGFEAGPEFTLLTFQRYADDFKCQYFGKNDDYMDKGGGMAMHGRNWEPTLQDIEGEYWRIIEKATEEIEVLYGADLETGTFGSGFPKASSPVGSAKDERYTKSGWNLNNFPRLPGSLLSFESGDISGVLVPWLYVGMCFSSFCWHVEDHHLYSLNYMHWGAPKMWYGVPGKDATKFEEAMRKYLPDLFEEQPDLLHKLVTQFSPSLLKSEGVPVYRCVQNSGEFVLTFPRAYHSGFNCGFNCAEAVNVAPVDWLPHGQIAIELYCEQGRRTSISHDKLLLGAAREAVRAHWELILLKKNSLENLRWRDVCGKDGILAKALKKRVETERMRREFLCSSSQSFKMDSKFDATSEKECSICLFDLHLSAAGCRCSPDKYACLIHAKQLCSCVSGTKYFLFRYDISELDILVEALEGKLSAVYRWARLHLGLTLSSSVLKDSTQHCKLSIPLRDAINREMRLLPEANSPKTLSGEGFSACGSLPSTGIDRGETSEQIKKLHIVAGLRAQSTCHISKVIEKERHGSHVDKKQLSPSSTSVCLLSGEDTSYAEEKSFGGCGDKEQSGVGCNGIIVLSDDEGNELKQSLLEKLKENNVKKCSDFSARVSNSSVMPGGDSKSSILACPVKNSACMSKTMSSTTPIACQDSCLSKPVKVKVEYLQNDGVHIGSISDNSLCHGGSTKTGYHKSVHDLSANNTACASTIISSTTTNEQQNNCLSSPMEVNVEHIPNGGTHVESSLAGSSCHGGSATTDLIKIVQDPSISRESREDKTLAIVESHDRQLHNCEKYISEKTGENVSPNPVDSSRSVPGSPSCSQNNLDRCLRQKGPRIAKVVRRINCNVEPLEFGAVVSGKLWCNSRAIFPKGFRSRVRYISVLDPTSMCYYISEIFGTRLDGPLFMVTLEHCQSEVFVHVSAARCWEMVRERVNQEITKQHKLGRTNLPPLQPPGSVDGFEMFGFSSPAIVQVIEALDRNRVCTDYWDSRPYSRPEGQIPVHCRLKGSTGNSLVSSDNQNNIEDPKGQPLPDSADKTLRGLFKKATSEELFLLRRILADNKATTDQGLVMQLLNKEFCNRPS